MTVMPSSLAPAARVAALSTLALAAACATNPVTGKRQLALVSEAQEIQMGQQASQEVAQTLGLIDVTRGMMTLMTSEAQLASVLGHEIGHVTARHSVTQISQQQLAQLGLGLGSIFSPAVQQLSSALGAGLQLLFLRHGRDDEDPHDG